MTEIKAKHDRMRALIHAFRDEYVRRILDADVEESVTYDARLANHVLSAAALAVYGFKDHEESYAEIATEHEWDGIHPLCVVRTPPRAKELVTQALVALCVALIKTVPNIEVCFFCKHSTAIDARLELEATTDPRWKRVNHRDWECSTEGGEDVRKVHVHTTRALTPRGMTGGVVLMDQYGEEDAERQRRDIHQIVAPLMLMDSACCVIAVPVGSDELTTPNFNSLIVR